VATRFDRGFRFPLQKYSDEKALYTNFKYIQEYLNYIRKKDLYATTIIVASSTSDEPQRAHYQCDGQNDNVEIQAAVDELSTTGGEVVLLEGTYNLAAGVTLPAQNITVHGAGAIFNRAGTLFVGSANGRYVLDHLAFTGGAADVRFIRGSGEWIVTDNYFYDLTATHVMGGDILGDQSKWIVVGNHFVDISLEFTPLLNNDSGLLVNDGGGTRDHKGIFANNYARNITGTGNGSYFITSSDNFAEPIFAIGNFIEDSTGLDGYFGNGSVASHNLIDQTMLTGDHDLDLNDLADVVISGTPADNEVLAYDSGSGDWINQTAAEAGLSAPGHTHTESDVTDLDHYDSSDFATDLALADTDDLTEGSNLYYTDERAQDAVGGILVDSSEIDFTYDDGTPSVTAVIVSGSVDEAKLDTSVNASLDLADSATQPGDDADTLGSGAATDGQVLTADGAGVAAWEDVPAGGAHDHSTLENSLTTNDQVVVQTTGEIDFFDDDGTTPLISVEHDGADGGVIYIHSDDTEETIPANIQTGEVGTSTARRRGVNLLSPQLDSQARMNFEFLGESPDGTEPPEARMAVSGTPDETPRFTLYNDVAMYVQALPAYFEGGTVYFTADDTFDKADYPGLRAIIVDLVGSGGAGGGAPATTGSDFSVGNGGGAGGHCRKFILASALSASETLTVPAGGTGVSGAAGNAGATCSFGSHCQATGGGAGGILTAGTALALLLPSAGGVGSGGDLNPYGMSSGFAVRITGGSVASAGQGGSSYFSAGGPFVISANGTAGRYGSGGGGMRNNGTASARTGGAGGNALIAVRLLF
jgi:hypothetical protein